MKISVLMVGPGEEVIGGISTLVETILPVLRDHVELLYLPTAQRRPVNESGRISTRNVALAISQYGRFLAALLRFHPDVVHLHTSQGIGWLKDTVFLIAAKAFGCHLVLHMHGGRFTELYAKSARLMRFYTRKVLGLASAVIEVSEERKTRLASIVPVERLFTFRNCITVNTAAPWLANRSENGTRALFLGVVGPSKGVPDLLIAMRELQSKGCPLQVLIAGHEEGDGDLARARAQVQGLGLQDVCHLVGPVKGAEKAQLLQEANLFVLPSYHEALPMSVLEAMSMGLPIVATAVGGIPEIVEDGYNGFLVAPGDTKALAEKLELLTSDGCLREAMGGRSREIVEAELAAEPYVRRLVELYKCVLGNRPKPAGKASS